MMILSLLSTGDFVSSFKALKCSWIVSEPSSAVEGVSVAAATGALAAADKKRSKLLLLLLLVTLSLDRRSSRHRTEKKVSDLSLETYVKCART